MTAGRPSEVESGVTINPFSLDIIDYLQFCFEQLEAGTEQNIPSDPWYEPRTGPITDEKVEEVMAVVDNIFDHEIDTYPDYHYRRSGASAKPEFRRLGYSAQRALVEGLLRIKEEYITYADEHPVVLTSSPAPDYDYEYC